MVQAQMFSVESKGAQPNNAWNQSLYLSGSWVDFTYTGGGDAQYAGNYEFNSPTIGLRYEIPGLDIYMNVGGGLTGMDEHSYVNVGAQLYQPFRLVGGGKFQLYAPLQLHSDFTRVVSERQLSGVDQFQQSMIAPGGGLMYGIEISDRIDYTGVGIAEYGFSFSAGNTFTGQVLGIQAQQRLSIANIFGAVGLALGYDLQFRRYNVEIDQYDYNLMSHHLYLGVNF
ncbi:MAG: hypothetical protein ACQETE_03925 [Bacteroidota bacterium]